MHMFLVLCAIQRGQLRRSKAFTTLAQPRLYLSCSLCVSLTPMHELLASLTFMYLYQYLCLHLLLFLFL